MIGEYGPRVRIYQYSQEHSLSFFSQFCKFESTCNIISDWLDCMVYPIRREVMLFSNTSKCRCKDNTKHVLQSG